MKNLMRKALAFALALTMSAPAYAGVPISDVHNNGKVIFVQAPDGTYVPAQSDASGNTAISGSISATLAGFTPNGNVASLSVTSSTGNVALPAGAVVLVTNTGTTNIAYIKLSVGAGTAATTDMALVAGATVGLTVGSNTFINAITASSTTTLRLAGGAGLVSGYGGGGGSSGGGGAITAADGAVATIGTTTDAKSTATDATGATLIQVAKQISASVQAPPSQAVTNAGTFAVQPAGSVAHDGAATSVNPNLVGGYASAAAPGDVSADGDSVRAWRLRNGSAAVTITAAGALVGGDATNGLDVDITRNAALVASSAIIGKVGIDQTTPGTTNGVYVTNNGVAIDTTTSGQTPSTVACNALSATPTAYTTAHTGPISCDLYGNIVTQPYSLPQNRVQGAITTPMTGTTSTSMIAAPGANLYNYITNISCKNAHATVGTLVAVQDGSGGTTMFQVAAAALFGGDNGQLLSPWKQTTANTALYMANVTTGASTTCMATGYKAP